MRLLTPWKCGEVVPVRRVAARLRLPWLVTPYDERSDQAAQGEDRGASDNERVNHVASSIQCMRMRKKPGGSNCKYSLVRSAYTPSASVIIALTDVTLATHASADISPEYMLARFFSLF